MCACLSVTSVLRLEKLREKEQILFVHWQILKIKQHLVIVVLLMDMIIIILGVQKCFTRPKHQNV